jgi:hypothetical protein
MKEMDKKMASKNIDLAESGRLLASIKLKSQSAQIKAAISGQIPRLKAKEKLDETAGVWLHYPMFKDLKPPYKKQG